MLFLRGLNEEAVRMEAARGKKQKNMADMKVGDRIRFLDATGGGIVKGFRGKDQVWVEDESGFEVPVLIRECVVVGENPQAHGPGRPADGVAGREREAAGTRPQPEEAEEATKETPEGERLNVFLAYLPTDPKALQQCGYEAYFVNDSNYCLFFNYMSRENNSWLSRCHGSVEPNTKIFMEEFGKKDLNALERVCVQLIAFKKDKMYSLKNAVSVELHLDTVKFYKLHCFVENDFFEEDAIICPVVRNDVPEREVLVSASELQEAMRQKVLDDSRPKPPGHPVSKKKEAIPPVLEVDLHIAELLDDVRGMSNGDMLNYQLGKFREVMEQYASRKGQKIVFIHGKGEGVLRKAIEKELNTRYKRHYYQDASFREYGFGATMVTIR